MRLVKIGNSTCAVGLQWKDGGTKNIRKEARAEALLFGAGEEDSAIGYAWSENADKSGSTYGLGSLKNIDGQKKLGRVYALGPGLASRLDDGLYIAKLDGVDGLPVFWLLGVSQGVVLPQTDQVFETLDDLQNNVAMLRTIMPDAELFLHPGMREVFVVDQHEWNFPDGFPSKKDVTVNWVGLTFGGISSLASVAKLMAIGGIFSAGAWFGWDYYQSQQTKGPTPEELAAQQAQMYEVSLQAIAADFSSEALSHKWEYMTRALDASRLVTSGFRVSHVRCDLTQCIAQFVSSNVGTTVPEHALAQMQGYIGGKTQVIAIPESQPGSVTLQWSIPSSDPRGAKDTDELIRWSQALPSRTAVEDTVRATSRQPAALLRSFVHIGGVEQLTVVRQTDTVPPGRVGVQAIQIPMQTYFVGFHTLTQEIGKIFNGTPAGFDVRFDESGISEMISVQIIAKVQI